MAQPVTITANLIQLKKLANGPSSYNKKRYGPGGSVREMNLDYRVTPVKCRLALHLYSKKTTSKKTWSGCLFKLSVRSAILGRRTTAYYKCILFTKTLVFFEDPAVDVSDIVGIYSM